MSNNILSKIWFSDMAFHNCDNWLNFPFMNCWNTKKYSIHRYILGALMHTTADFLEFFFVKKIPFIRSFTSVNLEFFLTTLTIKRFFTSVNPFMSLWSFWLLIFFVKIFTCKVFFISVNPFMFLQSSRFSWIFCHNMYI